MNEVEDTWIAKPPTTIQKLRIVPDEVPTELIVVENFFEELQAKVKR